MEQHFNIGLGDYTPNWYWDSGVWKFSLISADNQYGVFQIQSGRLLRGYQWNSETIVLNYIWQNQTWQYPNGTQIPLHLPIYVPMAQLSGNPLITVGNYQAYKLSGVNNTSYAYYQKDTGRLLYSVSFSTSGNVTDFSVIGLSATGYQSVDFGQYSISVTSNSTISATTYDPATSTLSFSATGPNNTIGYAEIHVPKALCANISSLKVYVDGVETEFDYEFIERIWDIEVSVWKVKISYQHSTRNIQIQIPEFSSFVLFACTLTTIAAFSSSYLQRKRLNKK